jgi:hypothetical protein
MNDKQEFNENQLEETVKLATVSYELGMKVIKEIVPKTGANSLRRLLLSILTYGVNDDYIKLKKGDQALSETLRKMLDFRDIIRSDILKKQEVALTKTEEETNA